MKTITIRRMLHLGIDIFDFPIKYKDKDFKNRFINHYMFRDIGFETIEMFKHYLEMEVERKTPYYNRLYDIVNSIDVELERGRKVVTDYKGDNTLKDKTSSDTTFNTERTVNTLNTLNSTIDNVLNTISDLETSGDIVSNVDTTTISETLNELKRDVETLIASVPYEIPNFDSSVDSSNKVIEDNKNDVNVKTTDKSKTTTTSDNKTKNISDTTDKQDRTDTGKTDTTTSGIDTTKITSSKDVSGNNTYEMVVEHIEKPLHQALEELRMVKLDITYDFIVSLNDLFSLVYY